MILRQLLQTPLTASWQHTAPLASAVVIVADTSNGKSADIKAYNYYGLRYHMRAPAAKGVHVTATQMAILSFGVTLPRHTKWLEHIVGVSRCYRNSLCSAGVASPAADSSRMSRLPKLVILYRPKRQLMPFPPKGIQKLFTEGLHSIPDKECYCSHATSLLWP